MVVQPWGAYPTSTHRYYEHDEEHVRRYQTCARAGGQSYEDYLREYIYSCASFDQFLDKAAGADRLSQLRDSMQAVV